MRVISLGWGIQSWALAAMSALGKLPPVDAAIHADTTYERAETYEFAARWTPWLEERGVRVVTVNGGRPVMGTLPGGGSYTSIPAFARWAEDVWDDGAITGVVPAPTQKGRER